MKNRLCALLLAGLMILTAFPSALADYEDIDGDGVWTIRDEILAESGAQEGLPSWYDSSMDSDSAWDDTAADDSSAWDGDSTDGLPSWYDSSMDNDSAQGDTAADDSSARDDRSADGLPSWYDSSMDNDSAQGDTVRDESPAQDDTTGEEYPWLTRSPDDGVTDAGNTSALDGRDTGETEEYPWLSIQDNGESVVVPELPETDTNRDGVINADDAVTGLPDNRDTETDGAEVTTETEADSAEATTETETDSAEATTETETDAAEVTTEPETEYLYDDGEEDTALQDLLQKERLEEVKDAESARQALYDLMESMNQLMESRAAESNPDNGDTPDNPGSGGGGNAGGGPNSGAGPKPTEPEPVDDTWEWESSEADDLLAVYTEAVTAQAATEYVESADVVINKESVDKLASVANTVTISVVNRASAGSASTGNKLTRNSLNVSVKKKSSSETAENKAEKADISFDPLMTDSNAFCQFETDSMSIIATIRSQPLRRAVSRTVTFSSDKTDITIRIEPDIKNVTTADKIQVKTPAYALTFTIADLKPDLNEALIIRCKDAGTMDAADGGSKIVEVDIPNGKLSNPFTISMPPVEGSVTYQTIANVQGVSGYGGNALNSDTETYRLQNGVERMANKNYKEVPSKPNPATNNIDGRTAQSGSYTTRNNPKDFTDIANKSAEMQNAIRYLASKGIINGTSESTFSPDNPITRAHIVALIMRGLGKVDNSLQAHFKDVPSNVWYYHELASSEKLNIINGYSDGTFRGNNTINKAQITTVAGRILVSEMKHKPPEGPEKSRHLKKYKDAVPGYAQDMVALATREDLVVYRKDGTFSGDSLMTRGDAAILLYRLFKRIWY